MNQQDNIEFIIYIDESGSAKPNPKDQCPIFAMGGVLIKRNNALPQLPSSDYSSLLSWYV
jgi:hypothetical protein